MDIFPYGGQAYIFQIENKNWIKIFNEFVERKKASIFAES